MWRKLYVLALSEIMMKGKGQREFNPGLGRVSGVDDGSSREGIVLL